MLVRLLGRAMSTTARPLVATRTVGVARIIEINRPDRYLSFNHLPLFDCYRLLFVCPSSRNAVNSETASELYKAFTDFDVDDSVSVAILTGAGGNFCAGLVPWHRSSAS